MSRVTRYELDTVVEEITLLPPDHYALVQVTRSIDPDKAQALRDHLPEEVRDRVILLVGHDKVFTVDEAVLVVAAEKVRQERTGIPRPVRDAPQA